MLFPILANRLYPHYAIGKEKLVNFFGVQERNKVSTTLCNLWFTKGFDEHLAGDTIQSTIR